MSFPPGHTVLDTHPLPLPGARTAVRPAARSRGRSHRALGLGCHILFLKFKEEGNKADHADPRPRPTSGSQAAWPADSARRPCFRISVRRCRVPPTEALAQLDSWSPTTRAWGPLSPRCTADNSSWEACPHIVAPSHTGDTPRVRVQTCVCRKGPLPGEVRQQHGGSHAGLSQPRVTSDSCCRRPALGLKRVPGGVHGPLGVL